MRTITLILISICFSLTAQCQIFQSLYFEKIFLGPENVESDDLEYVDVYISDLEKGLEELSLLQASAKGIVDKQKKYPALKKTNRYYNEAEVQSEKETIVGLIEHWQNLKSQMQVSKVESPDQSIKVTEYYHATKRNVRPRCVYYQYDCLSADPDDCMQFKLHKLNYEILDMHRRHINVGYLERVRKLEMKFDEKKEQVVIKKELPLRRS